MHLQPRVWVLTDNRPGNISQSLGLVDALEWSFERKDLGMGLLSILSNRILGASLRGYDLQRSSILEPPWPDLVIACGRRTAPAALWIKKQSRGNTRLVVLGRKAGDAAHLFDLAVTPKYGRGVPHPHRMELEGPLHSITPRVLEDAEKEWSDTLCRGVKSPRVAVFVGGQSGQYRFGVEEATRFGARIAEWASQEQASIFISTSRRTGVAQTRALNREIGSVAHSYCWGNASGPNPFRGYLACADAFVITADSESMIAEALSTGKPVLIYRLPFRSSFRVLRVVREWAVRRAALDSGSAGPRGLSGSACLHLIALGWIRPTRDLDQVQASLLRRGFVRYFEDGLALSREVPVPEIERVANRVRELMRV